jgi:CoA-transferase family III
VDGTGEVAAMTGLRTRSLLAQLWSALDGDPELLDRVRISGPEQVLPSVFDVTGLAAASVAVATLAVAEFGARRRGTDVPEVGVDRFTASAAFRSEALLQPLGWERPPIWDPIAGDYRSADGWIRLHTNYAYHRAAALRALELADGSPDAGPDRDQVAARVRRFPASELERRVVIEGGCAAALYTADEWAAHPHGSVAVAQPPIVLERAPASGRPRWSGVDGDEGDRPLAGIKVLDLTRVIAGPVCTRTLAAWGADVLRIDPPGFAEVGAVLPDTTAGKHCTAMDLRQSEDRARFEALVAEADVIVHGLRPGALAGLGYSSEVLRWINGRIAIATLDAYGWSGPWAGRRGFDSLVQFSTGIAAAGAAGVGSDRPVSLPAQALDHATGYLLAAAVGRGLSGQATGLGAASARGALVGPANLLRRLTEPGWVSSADPVSSAGSAGPGFDFAGATGARDTDWGPVMAVGQPGTIDGVSGAWRVPAGPLGRHPASFAN